MDDEARDELAAEGAASPLEGSAAEESPGTRVTEEPSDPDPGPGEPPVDEPPADEPPVSEPDTGAPPIGEPPVEQPPADSMPADATPAAPESSDAPHAMGDTAEIAAIEESLTDTDDEAPSVAEGDGAPVASDSSVADADASAAVLALEPVPGVDLGPEGRSNVWVWVGLVVGVLIALAALGYLWWYQVGRDITVPNVVGKLPAQATQALNDAGLRLGKVSEEPTESAPAGTVISQVPPASSTSKPGSAVSFVLAAAPTSAKVPNVAGRKYEEAVELLASARLAAYRVDSYSSTVAVGFVESQLPTMGAQLQPGAVVALAVSKGPAPSQATVPRLAGLTESEAVAALSSAGFSGNAYRSYSASVTAGSVATQSPAPGTSATYGSAVQYLVSQGPGTASVSVPDVKGLSRSEAEKRLTNAGLKPQVIEAPSVSVAKGMVASQMPPAGSKTAKGGVVGLLVSKGNLSRAAAPTIVGKPSEEASKAVSSAGFTPFIVQVKTAEYPAGQVFQQWPLGGTQWPLRFPILALAAKAP